MLPHFALRLAGCLTLAAALPAHAETNALGGASPLSATAATETAGPNQLFPPLPSLASLPPSSAQQLEEEAAPVANTRRAGRKARRAAPRKTAEAAVRVIVSDESQAYLSAVERTLDDALRGAARDSRESHDSHERHGPAGPVSVAQVR